MKRQRIRKLLLNASLLMFPNTIKNVSSVEHV